MTAWILAGGPLVPSGRLRRATEGATLVVAADGGLRHAATLGLTPSVVVGDMDSVESAALQRWHGVPTEHHPTDKDATDLELAAAYAVRHGARSLRVVGAFGGRLDQTLAATMIASGWAEAGLDVALVDGTTEVWPVASGGSRVLHVPRGTVFSLLSVTEHASVGVRGARYEHAALHLPRGVGLGTSNVTTSCTHVDVHQGTVLIVVQFDAEAST